MDIKKRSPSKTWILFGALPVAAFWLIAAISTILEADGRTSLLEPMMALQQLLVPILVMPVNFYLALKGKMQIWKLLLFSAAIITAGNILWVLIALSAYQIPFSYIDLVVGSSFLYGYLSELLVLVVLFGALALTKLIAGKRKKNPHVPAGEADNVRNFKNNINVDAFRVESDTSSTVYKSNVGFIMLGGVYAGFVMTLLVMFVYWLFKFDIDSIYYAWAACLPLGMLYSFLFRNIRVQVGDEGVLLLRNNRAYQALPYRQFQISSFIQKYRIYFIPMPSSKYLRTAAFSGGQKMYCCYNFSNKVFTDLIVDITRRERALYASSPAEPQSEVDFEGSRYANTAESYVETDSYQDYLRETSTAQFESDSQINAKTVFDIPKGKLITGNRKRTIQISIGMIVAGGAMLALYYFLFYKRFAPVGSNAIGYATLLILVAFIAVPVITMLLKNALVARRIPEQITVWRGSIEIDGRQYPLSDISVFKMTPPGYNTSGGYSHQRKMEMTAFGERFKWNLGSTFTKNLVYAEYPALCQSLEQLFESKGMYIYKL